MEIPIEQAPGSYVAIRCVKEFDCGIKVFMNISELEDIYYTVAQEPEPELIQSPDDIETLAVFKKQEFESRSYVRNQALDKAAIILEHQEREHDIL